MNRPGLSICLDDLNLEIKAALKLARDLGFFAIDIAAASGAISPSALSKSGQRHLMRHLGNLGLRLGSLRGPTGGPSYDDGATGDRRLALMRDVLTLASALRVPVASTTVGELGPGAERGEIGGTIEALEMLADDADRLGVRLAVETTGIASSRLSQILSRIGCPSLGACCDSGPLLMSGEDPGRTAAAFAGRVHLVRARDAVPGTGSRPGYEVVMGEGGLDGAGFVAGLSEAGFGGDIVLSRTTGDRPAVDLRRAMEYFEPLLRCV